MEDVALKRKAKLQALKERANEKRTTTEKEEGKPKLKFRNYNPQSEELKESKLPKTKPEDAMPQIQEQLESAKEPVLDDINLANLAPRKVDWDLKRDIKGKLERLERRTEKAIVELIHERLKGSDEGNELASAVATVGDSEQTSAYDSD